jgi:hypothetical protein
VQPVVACCAQNVQLQGQTPNPSYTQQVGQPTRPDTYHTVSRLNLRLVHPAHTARFCKARAHTARFCQAKWTPSSRQKLVTPPAQQAPTTTQSNMPHSSWQQHQKTTAVHAVKIAARDRTLQNINPQQYCLLRSTPAFMPIKLVHPTPALHCC